MSAFARHDRVLVSPRHLAGGGPSRINDAIGPLIHLFDWHTDHNPDTGRVSLDSPDGSLFVDFDPTTPDKPWWSIRNHEPHWTAEFTRQTPAEAVAAVTQSLPQLLGDHRHAERIPLTDTDLAETAALNHWTATTSADGTAYTSPDGYCTLRHAPGAETAWRVENSLADGFDTHWSATFTTETPHRVVAQFFAHLTTTAPVEREYREIPYTARDFGDTLITPARTTGVNPQVPHAAAQAAHARAARRR
ncbi:DUF317 domain-containing protein [Streptomyces sp. NPDC057654]|uniref:DUF317 domain-containing protein n=1 Tax=Streptomyces sp. NPDC057654 TaxID=3346196 RepID=UPI0036BADF4E